MASVPPLRHRSPGHLSAVTIQQRVRVLAVVGIAATVGVAGVAFVSLQRSRALTRQVAVTSAGDRIFLANEAVRQELVARVLESLYLTADDPDAGREEARTEFAAFAGQLEDGNQAQARLALPESLAAPVRQVASELDAFSARASSMIDRVYGSDRTQATRDVPGFLAASDEIDQHAAAIPFRAEIDALNERAGKGQRQAVVLLWLAAALAVSVLLLGAHWVVRRIRAALGQVSAAATRMTGGDLSTRVVHHADDEVGELADSFNTLAATLSETFDRLDADARRENFNTRLVEALEMVDTEGEVLETVSRAMAGTARLPMELLLSDSSRANMERGACHPQAGAPGCSVGSPFQCAAVRRGNPMVFESSAELNACPKLRDRPGGDIAGVCVPVSFMGRAMGVLHATAPAGEAPAAELVSQLTQIATVAGARIGTVRAFQQTQLQAATDALTGLANRRTVEGHVRELFAAGQLFSFVMADLDFFKRLNDSNGHEMGDRALRLFARVFGESLPPNGLASRWGGEEFAAVLPGMRADEAAVLLDRLRALLADAVKGGETPSFTASFGVADSATVGNLELLLRTADDALYAAKEAGRDRVAVGDPGRSATTRMRSVEHDARIDATELAGFGPAAAAS